MPKLVNMKIDPKDREKMAETVAADAPMYPWGLGLHLDNDVIEKLGTGALPEAGGEVLVLAKAKVTSISSQEHEGGKKHRNISLQITDLALDLPPEEAKNAADVLYSKG